MIETDSTGKANPFRAMLFATDAHKSQRRKYTDAPYITHCAEVAALVASCCFEGAGYNEVVCAAWLHDTVEDCGVELHTISNEFGPIVATYVRELTDVSKPSDGNRATRKAIDRAHTASSSFAAQTIKLADLISNTRSIVQYDPAFGRVYLAEKRLLLDAMTGNSEMRKLAEQVWSDGMSELGRAES